MSALDLLRRLHNLDIRLIVDGEKLRVSAPKDAMTDDIRAQIGAHKQELLRLLGDADRDGGAFIEPASRLTPLPLSSQQQRLWFISQLQPDSPAYNINSSIRLQGTLDIDALRAALDGLLARHEALRTVFTLQDGRPVQTVRPAGPVEFEREDISTLPEGKRQAAWHDIIARRGRRSFNLSNGSLLRAFVTKFAENDHILTCSMHHIASDGWSVSVMYRDLAALYAAGVTGEAPALPELPIQYPDYAAWQRKRLDGPALQPMVEHWVKALDDVSSLELPTDKSRPAMPTWKGASETVLVPAEVVRGLEKTARSQGASKFMVLLAVYNALLSRLTGQDDIVVGSPIAGRDRSETEGLIGFFINTLIMRTSTADDPTFAELVSRVRATALDAFSHQDVPFEKIVDRVAPDRDISRNPIFQVTFALQNVGGVQMELPGLKVSPLPPAGGTTRFDLETHVSERADGGLSIGIVYSTDLFDAATIREFADRFALVARACADNPSARLSQIPFMLPDERDRLVTQWGRDEREYPRDETIVRRFERVARERPDAIAVEHPDQTLTYSQLNERANRLSHRLISMGVKPDSLVAMCIDRTPDRIVTILAILKAGGAYAPLDPAYPRQRLEWMLQDLDTPVVVTEKRHESIMPARQGTTVLLLDAEQVDLAGRSATDPGVALRPDNLAYINYTSGSTGTPKGVLIPHRAVLRLVFSQDYIKFGPEKNFLHMSTISFDASTLELWGPLLHGGKLVLLDGDSPTPEALRDAFENRGVTSIFITTALFNSLTETDATVFAALEDLLVGGDALSVPIVRSALDKLPPTVRLINAYGPTECTTFATCHEIPRTLALESSSVPIGKPLSNTRLYVLDQFLNPVPTGVVGELYLGGDGVARGYRNRPDADAERFIELPGLDDARVYRTGDLVRWTRDGLIEFLGRRDTQIKIRGYRVELGEIENALHGLPSVRHAAVLCRQDTPGVKRLVAYVTPNPGFTLDAAAMTSELGERLPAYMVPSVFVLLDKMPLTATGKLNRRALPEPEAASGKGGAAGVAPRNDVERALVEVWERVLKRKDIGIHDNFFEMGGESILSIQVVSRAREAGIHLTPRHMFQHQTIAELAAVAGQSGAAKAEQGVVTGDVATTPVIAWFLDQKPVDAHHFNQAFLFEVASQVTPDAAEKALRAIMTHHDALRLRVNDRGSLSIAPDDAPLQLGRHDLSAIAADRRAAEIERIASGSQASFDLTRGPIVRAEWFAMGAGGRSRLMVAAHHLAVDIVSWHVIMEDLQRGCEQAMRGEPITLPAKTTSFKDWAGRIAGSAKSDAIAAQEPFWLEMMSVGGTDIPTDSDERENSVDSADSVHLAFNDDETRALLEEVPQRHRAQINEALLAALGAALAQWTGRARTLIDLEGHGREDLFEGVDLSRTVGWFTSIYPMALEAADAGQTPGELLRQTKDRLRAAPDKGVGYGVLRYLRGGAVATRAKEIGEPTISFNYAGKFEQAEAGTGAGAEPTIRFAREPIGPIQSPRSRRAHLIDITGSVSAGRLRMAFHFSRNRHRRSTIEHLAKLFAESLRAIVEDHGATARLAPSDFPASTLTQAHLDGVFRDYAEFGIEDVYTLTPLQRVMLFQTISAPRSGVFMTQFAFTLKGDIDAEALRQAWRQTMDRTPVLRTGFVWRAVDDMHQVVARRVPLPWIEADLRGKSEADRKEAIRQYLRLDRSKGFDMTRPPLMRIAMIRISDTETMMLWTHHHSLLDGWSVPQLLSDVFGRYGAIRAGSEAKVSPRPAYREHIAWIKRQDRAAADAFWKRMLTDMSHPTTLVVDRNPGALPGENEQVDEQTLPLTREETVTLQSFAQKHRLTLNTIMQGAWALLLSRYSGDAAVTYGVIVSGRPADLPDSDRIIGLFINGLPMRASIDPTVESGKWLGQIQELQSEMRQFEYSALTDIAGLIGYPRGTPLFNTTVVFENYPVAEGFGSSAASTGVADVDVTSNTNSALHLRILPGSRVTLRLVHDVSRFDKTTATRMLEQLRSVVLQVAASDGATTLGDLSFLCETDTRLLPDPAAPLDDSWNGAIFEHLSAHARSHPAALAVRDPSTEWTYSQLNAAANRLANRLIAGGVRKGDIVAIYAHRSAPLVQAIMGVLKSGATYVIFDPAYPSDRMAECLRVARPTALVALREGGEVPELVRACLDEVGCACRVTLPGDASVDSAPDTDPGVLVGPDDVAVVAFTSGSTGKPKGVMGRHGPLTHFVPWMSEQFGLSADDRFTMLSAISHDPLQRDVFTPIQLGATLCIPHPDAIGQPGAIARWMRVQHATVTHLTPAMGKLVTDDPSAELVPSLRNAFFVGDVLTHRDATALYRLAPNVRCINMYGSTETQRAVTYHVAPPAGEIDDSLRPFPIGVGMKDVQIVILDDHGRRVGSGEVGEVLFRSPHMAKGYLGDADLSAQRFIANPFGSLPGDRMYRTGDRGVYFADGGAKFAGRRDFQVKIRGFRVELGEIEEAIKECPGVKDAAVKLHGDDRDEKMVVGYFVGSVEMSALRAELRSKLPTHMVPAALINLPVLPRTVTNKIDRAALPAPDMDAVAASSAFVPPTTPTEEAVAGIWAELLKRERVGAHDNFFDIGGHSLMATRMVSMIRDAFGVDVPLRKVFERPTVAGVGEILEEALLREIEGMSDEEASDLIREQQG